LYDCDATVLLNVYIYLLFVGEGWLALMSRLQPVRGLCLEHCDNVRYNYMKEFMNAVPELEINDLIINFRK
jgi:hypothetical protein